MLLALTFAASLSGSVLRGQTKPQAEPPSTRIILTLTDAQIPTINGQIVPWKELEGQLDAIYTHRPQRVLYVRTHPKNGYKALTRVVDLARRRGITVNFLP